MGDALELLQHSRRIADHGPVLLSAPLAGQHALITGGGSGIGLACAQALAADGARVSLLGRNADKLRDAAYNTLSPATRRHLHRRVAQALESVYAPEPDTVARRVAAHFDRAGLPERAIPFYLRAGEAANRIYAHDEAAASFRRGLELLEKGPMETPLVDWREEMVAGLYEGLGDDLRLGSPSEAHQAYQLAVEATDDELFSGGPTISWVSVTRGAGEKMTVETPE